MQPINGQCLLIGSVDQSTGTHVCVDLLQGSEVFWEGSNKQGIFWATSDDGGTSWGGHRSLVPAPDGLPAWGPVLHTEVSRLCACLLLSDSRLHDINSQVLHYKQKVRQPGTCITVIQAA